MKLRQKHDRKVISYSDYLSEVLHVPDDETEDVPISDEANMTLLENEDEDDLLSSFDLHQSQCRPQSMSPPSDLAISSITAATTAPAHVARQKNPSSSNLGLQKLVQERESMELNFTSSQERDLNLIEQRSRLSVERASLASALQNTNSNALSHSQPQPQPRPESQQQSPPLPPQSALLSELASKRDRSVLRPVPAPTSSSSSSSSSSYNAHLDELLNSANYSLNILSPKTTQSQLFDAVGKPMVVDLIQQATSSVCYAVGASKSGKHHTMYGGNDESNYEEALGLIPRVTIQLMANMQMEQYLKLSVVEVANATANENDEGHVFRDLLLNRIEDSSNNLGSQFHLHGLAHASQVDLNEPLDVEFFLKNIRINSTKNKNFAKIYTLHLSDKTIRMVLCHDLQFNRRLVTAMESNLTPSEAELRRMVSCCNVLDRSFASTLSKMEQLMNGTRVSLDLDRDNGLVDFEAKCDDAADSIRVAEVKRVKDKENEKEKGNSDDDFENDSLNKMNNANVEKVEKERDEALAELENAIASEAAVQEELAAAKKTIDQLSAKLDSFEIEQLQLQNLNETIREMELDLEKASGRSAELEFNLDEAQASNENLRSTLERKEVQIHTMSVKCLSLSDNKEKLELQLKQAIISKETVSESVKAIASGYKQSETFGEAILLRKQNETLLLENEYLKNAVNNGNVIKASLQSQCKTSKRMLELKGEKSMNDVVDDALVRQYNAVVGVGVGVGVGNSNNNSNTSNNNNNNKPLDSEIELETQKQLRLQAESYSNELQQASNKKQQLLAAEILELRKELVNVYAANDVSHRVIAMESSSSEIKKHEFSNERMRMEKKIELCTAELFNRKNENVALRSELGEKEGIIQDLKYRIGKSEKLKSKEMNEMWGVVNKLDKVSE